MDEESAFVQVMTTMDDRKKAKEMAEELVKKRLAACVQLVGPIRSTYEWDGRLENSEEWLCVLKSKRSLYEELEEAIKDMHTYDNPEIIAQPIILGSEGYLDWVAEKTK